MPLLNFRSASRSASRETSPLPTRGSEFEIDKAFRPGLIGQCANPGCNSGWLHLFRKRSTPVFEGGWTCSPECTEARLQFAVRREFDSWTPKREVHRHRVPLGLLMLEKGWITRLQLRKALEAQRSRGTGRVGEWLVRQGTADEATVTRALGLQWSCPVYSLDSYVPASVTSVMPRLFLDAYGALPARVVEGKLLYLGFEERPDPVVALAIKRMTGLRVENVIVQSSVFRSALAQVLKEKFPNVQLAEAASEAAAAHLLAKIVERAQPAESRLVLVHDCLWLRMFFRAAPAALPGIGSVNDVVCTIGRF